MPDDFPDLGAVGRLKLFNMISEGRRKPLSKVGSTETLKRLGLEEKLLIGQRRTVLRWLVSTSD
jgi:hypothetical protein